MPEVPDVTRHRLGSIGVTLERIRLEADDGTTTWSPPFLVLTQGPTRVELIPPDGMAGFDVGVEIKVLAAAMDALWLQAR